MCNGARLHAEEKMVQFSVHISVHKKISMIILFNQLTIFFGGVSAATKELKDEASHSSDMSEMQRQVMELSQVILCIDNILFSTYMPDMFLFYASII